MIRGSHPSFLQHEPPKGKWNLGRPTVLPSGLHAAPNPGKTAALGAPGSHSNLKRSVGSLLGADDTVYVSSLLYSLTPPRSLELLACCTLALASFGIPAVRYIKGENTEYTEVSMAASS